MTPPQQDKRFEQLIRRIEPQSKLLRSWSLPGGVSAQVTALEISRPNGHTQKWIVRQHGAVDRRHNPHIAADEFRLLHILHAAGLPVPMPVHVDDTGQIFPTPYLVVEYIDGATDFAPANLADCLHQCATHLARIHRVDSASVDVSFLHDQDAIITNKLRESVAQNDHSLDVARIRETLQVVWPLPPTNQRALLHGDFWPGNLLWQDGVLVGIIDWEDARRGDPLADLANSRLEMLWAFGLDAMHAFTQQYHVLMPTIDYTHLPYWDLYTAWHKASQFTQWTDDDAKLSQMRDGLRLFVAQAFEKLSGQ